MCILFLSLSKNPCPGGYKLILASNRDETFARPTNPAQFWTEFPDIIGGQDMEPGREGGTWLALKKSGKIGTLLNIFTDVPIAPDKLGRGFLVNDFLHGDLSGFQYGKSLQAKAHLYNPFNFVAIELQKNVEPTVTYYSSESAGAEPIQFEICGNDNVYAFGNSVYHLPFQKVLAGKRQVEQLVRLHSTKESEEQLVAGLLEILKSREKHYPDAQMTAQVPSYSETAVQEMSSKFVWIPSSGYGSRTHTIILVDDEDWVTFMEWTMDTPVDTQNPTWSHSKYKFRLD